MTRLARTVAALIVAAGTAPPAGAGVLAYCDAPAPLDATQQDRLLRLAAVIKAELQHSGAALALIARAGLDLDRWGQRYSHAGISLRASPNGPWSVRQLYYDCDRSRPRLFDQGIAGFVFGAADPAFGHVSVVLLPARLEAPLAAAALDKAQALALLGETYSANAYPFAARYQNCNQWVAEMLALAWGAGGGGSEGATVTGANRNDGDPTPTDAADPGAASTSAADPGEARTGAADPGEVRTDAADPTEARSDAGDAGGTGSDASTHALRRRAQRWLHEQGYQPALFDLGDPFLTWLAGQLPWLHTDDHPPADLAHWRLRVSMPASIESFVRARTSAARRIEFCHDSRQIVVHPGWTPIGKECAPVPGDRVVPLD